MELGNALLRYHSAGYLEVRNGNSQPLLSDILDELWNRVNERELDKSREWMKDMRADLWNHGVLRGLVKDFINHLFENEWEWWLENFENGRNWMTNYFEEVSDMNGEVMHREDTIIRIYGFDRAMTDFFEEFNQDKAGSYDGLQNFIAARCLEEAVAPFAWFMFKAMQETICKLHVSVGECPICSDEESVLLTLPCGHAFGAKCLQEWVVTQSLNESNKTCPMCRKVFYPDPLFLEVVY
jgi:hypothetical protein